MDINNTDNNVLFKFILAILIFFLLRIVNLNSQLKILIKNKSNNKNNYKYFCNRYNDLLQSYIENRTEFYIKGRQILMRSIGKDYNDSKINNFQDKLNWLLVHESPELKTDIVDKILLRNYSRKILGKDICVPIIKIYDNINEIKLDELPEKFVLKCNHGSQMNIICHNKSEFNLNDAKKQLDKWIKLNYALIGYEYQYLNVKRKIFSEQYLKDNLTDYKFYCFNGFPKLIKVQSKYYKKDIKMYHYYNENWKKTNIETNLPENIKLNNDFPKPKNFNLMMEYAKKFAKNFSFIRVDLYEFNNTVYLSELTFTPANARTPYKDEKQRIYLGNLLDLSKVISN